MKLPEYVKEGPVERKERFERFLRYIDATVVRGNKVRAVEAYSLVMHSRTVGALTDDLTIPLVELIVRKFKGETYEEPKTAQGDLFS